MAGGRFKELLKKYGKVAFGVHFSVSGASIAGLFVAIKSNVDVESILAKLHLPGISSSKDPDEVSASSPDSPDGFVSVSDNSSNFNGGGGDFSAIEEDHNNKKRNRTAELATSTGGALALAILCNKALLPVRIPITIALTPPVARFLARRKIIKTSE